MDANERVKEIIRKSVCKVETDLLTYCPENHARQMAQAGLQQSLRFALLSIDQAKTKPEIVVPGH